MHKKWMFALIGLMLVGPVVDGFAADVAVPKANPAVAQRSARTGLRPSRGSFGFLGKLQRSVGLTPEQVDAVRGLLAQQREQIASVREQTDSRIRAILAPEQQKKFDAFLAELKSRAQQRRSERT